MSERLVVTGAERIMVVAPHPDDESLAAGGLLLEGARQGAAVRVVFFSDGERNPWAQRVVERRLWVGPEERLHFGERRREEALTALGRLGLCSEVAHFLAFPDQGATGLLLRAERSPISALSEVLRVFRPSLLVCPSSYDLHPDHSAVSLLLAQCLRELDGNGPLPRILTYVVHHWEPRAARPPSVVLELAPESQACKREAIACHRSQLFWRGRQYLSFAAPVEVFWPAGSQALTALHPIRGVEWRRDHLCLSIAPPSRPRMLGPRTLLLAGWNGSGAPLRWSLELHQPPAVLPLVDLRRRAPAGAAILLAGRGCELLLVSRSALGDVVGLVAKLERRLSFFDEGGWHSLEDGAAVPMGALRAIQ